MFSVRTKRLQLLPLHLSHLKLLKESRVLFEADLDLKPSNLQTAEWIAPQIEETIEYWIECISDDPTNYLWHTNWEIILTEENRSIGNTGFNGMPDNDGEIIIGYSIDLNYHNKGYMTEALQAMIKWAKKSQRLKRILAETPSNNYSSHRVLEKNGFKHLESDANNKIWLWGLDVNKKRFLIF